MVLRVSREDAVMYASESLLAYLGVHREEIEGRPLANLAALSTGEVSECFHNGRDFLQPNTLVTDAEGRVFELKTASESGVLDIVLDEVTTAEQINDVLAAVSGTDVEELSEEELRTVRHPDLRFLTVCRTRLHAEGRLTGAMSPVDHRILTNAFLDEASEALICNGCTLMPSANAAVAGMAGAPRYHADHSLRILNSAFDQIERVARLREAFCMEGKEMPPIGCGIASGEVVVGTFGSHRSMRYGAEGACVETTEILSRIAAPGEVLLTEGTLRNLLQNVPEGWQAVQTSRDEEPDLAPYAMHAGTIQPLEDAKARCTWIIGPGVEEDWSKAAFVFDYLWELQTGPAGDHIAVLRAMRMGGNADAMPSRSGKVLASGFIHRLGKYRLSEVIGSGGMGRVWKAQDVYGNTVAIKTLKTTENASSDEIKRFRREAEVMSRLPHRNICRIFEINEHEGTHYIVMEHVDGLSLAEVLQEGSKSTRASSRLSDLPSLIAAVRSAKSSADTAIAHDRVVGGAADQATHRAASTLVLPVEQALLIFEKVCEAVEFAHGHGVLHRDLKAGNILLRGDGEPLVADFGLAKLSTGDSGASLSVSGHVLGTIENMAPEQAQSSKTVDEKADVYSLGTILFQMLTGGRHFQASGNLLADIQALQNHEPPRPRTLNPRLDPDLEVIILKCLRHDPTQRYRGAGALLADIRRYRSGEPISARPLSTLDLARKLVRRNKTATATAAVSSCLIFLVVAASVWGLTRQLSNERTARRESEDLRAKAEASERRAQEKQIEAENNERRAVENQKHAEEQAALANTSLRAKELAEAETLRARQDSAAERLIREQMEKDSLQRTQDYEKEITGLKTAAATTVEVPQSPLLDPAVENAARALITKAEGILVNGFPESVLTGMRRKPEAIVERLSEAIDRVAEALCMDAQYSAAWLLKGRLHLGAMEFDAAAKSFEMAKSTAQASSDAPDPSDVDRLLEFASTARVAFDNEPTSLASPLLDSKEPPDQAAGRLLAFFSRIKAPHQPSAASPIGRTASSNEIALSLKLANQLATTPVVEGGPSPLPLRVEITGNAGDLSALHGASVKVLAIRDTEQIDWPNAANLPLDTLEITGSQAASLPASSPFYKRLTSLTLRNSAISSIDAAREMPMLETLDISGTNITDIEPLNSCRGLRRLDLGDLENLPLESLRLVPLESLTVSEDVATNQKALLILKSIRSIRRLRTTEDPQQQSTEQFWNKRPDPTRVQFTASTRVQIHPLKEITDQGLIKVDSQWIKNPTRLKATVQTPSITASANILAKAYFFDANKVLVASYDAPCAIWKGNASGTHEDTGLPAVLAQGKRVDIYFAITPDMEAKRWKTALVVFGDKSSVTVRMKPEGDMNAFDFPEKSLTQHTR